MCFDRALLPANATRGKNSSGPRPVSRILFAEAIARPLLLSYYFIRLLFVCFAQLRAQLENRRTIFVIFQFNSRSLKFDRRSSGSSTTVSWRTKFRVKFPSGPLKINPRFRFENEIFPETVGRTYFHGTGKCISREWRDAFRQLLRFRTSKNKSRGDNRDYS